MVFILADRIGGAMAYDLIIRNEKVVDGSGLPAFQGDVFFSGGCVIEIGRVGGDALLLRKFSGSFGVRIDT